MSQREVRPKIGIVLLAVLAGVLRYDRACFATEVNLLDRFRKEYTAAAAKLDAAYSHVKIETTGTSWGSSGEIVWTTRSEFLREGELIRKVTTIVKSYRPDTPDGFLQASGGSSEKYFSVARAPAQKQFEFLDFGPKGKKEFIRDAPTKCYPVFATCWGDSWNIYELVNSPKTTLVSASLISLEGQSVVDVLAQQQTNPAGLHAVVHLYFLPESWAFAGWTWHILGGKATLNDPHTVLEIRNGYQDGDPMKLKSIRRWHGTLGPTPVRRDDYAASVSSIEFGPIPKEQFTLASLGIAEPGSVRPQQGFRWLLALNLLICALLGTALTIIAYRRTRRTN